MVTALDQPADRLKGFEPGADDFLIKPVDDVALVKRVRKLARLKMLTDEMLMRASTEEQLGFAGGLHKPFDQVAQRLPDTPRRGCDGSYRRIQDALGGEFELAREADPASALRRLPDGDFDLIIVSLSLRDAGGLRLCSQVPSLARARHLPILIIAEPGDEAPLLRPGTRCCGSSPRGFGATRAASISPAGLAARSSWW